MRDEQVAITRAAAANSIRELRAALQAERARAAQLMIDRDLARHDLAKARELPAKVLAALLVGGQDHGDVRRNAIDILMSAGIEVKR